MLQDVLVAQAETRDELRVQGRTLTDHSRTLADHGRTLADHGRLLAEQGRTLVSNGRKLDDLADQVADCGRRSRTITTRSSATAC
ncbi:MAG: hypothetical protein JO326_00145 [Acetobacteraceae bacterium]|nr:hypothetical protein [Acetobacteraceae bacterium]